MGCTYVLCVLLLLGTLIVKGSMSESNNNNNVNDIPSSSPSSDMSKRGLTSLTDPVPSSGNQRLLVLTVGYPNLKGSYTGAEWKNGLFEEWVQFFRAQSYNKLRYTVDVVTINNIGMPVINDPTSKRYIPLQEKIGTYANGEHGWDFGSEWSLHTIVKEACTYLDNKKFNWNYYLQNGTVQNVLIMSAGYDYRYAEEREDAKSNFLLSTSYSGVYYRTRSGSLVNSYTFCSEHTQTLESKPTMAHLGQCAHEFGHALGIPDLYDLSFKTSGVGYFDLLGYGVYANNLKDGSRPVGFGAWPKTALGWSEPLVIRNTTEIRLGPTSLSPHNMLKVYPTSSNDTYLLIETRQPIDKWDINFIRHYTSGVLIWIINEPDSKKFTPYNSINSYPTADLITCPSRPSVVVAEADGSQDMSSLSGDNQRDYGSPEDVWEPGDQFTFSNNFSIGIMQNTKDHFFVIRISYNGSINMDDAVYSSVSPLLSPPPSFSLFFFVFVFVFLCTLL